MAKKKPPNDWGAKVSKLKITINGVGNGFNVYPSRKAIAYFNWIFLGASVM